MRESSKDYKDAAPSTPVTTERNRLMSWDKAVQELTKPVAVMRISKIGIILRPLLFVSKKTRLIPEKIVKLPYTLFKLGYEIAKIFTRGLSSIRLLMFPTK